MDAMADRDVTIRYKGSEFSFLANARTPFPLAVCAHERSGTHFLMNSIHLCTGYAANPLVNFDLDPLGASVNFYSRERVAKFIDGIARIERDGRSYCVSSLIKSHHVAWLFEQALGSGLRVAYIYRNPVDVFVSYWRFLKRWSWLEGPDCESPRALAEAAPCGQSMRYQLTTQPSYFDRWASHVSGWLEAAETSERVAALSYAALKADHAATMQGLAERLGLALTRAPRQPSREANVIEGVEAACPESEIEALRACCRERIADYPRLAHIEV